MNSPSVSAREWTFADARSWVRVPQSTDDKYSRGVLGVITGSELYPGAAVIGVDAALHTGLGMVRYLGPEFPTRLVLQSRPESVIQPGRVQAWLVGSGMDPAHLDPGARRTMREAFASGEPCVVDAGALSLGAHAVGPTILTPHAGELAMLLGCERAEVEADPRRWCLEAAHRMGVCVLLKGARSVSASPGGAVLTTPVATPWLSTAGTGDCLAGILGALVASHAGIVQQKPALLTECAMSASVIHAEAARRASGGGPFTVRDLIAAVPGVIGTLASSAAD